jgi:hypothetical protein
MAGHMGYACYNTRWIGFQPFAWGPASKWAGSARRRAVGRQEEGFEALCKRTTV